jgi:L-ascorbate metabolism protein UlaG (beta-lactamase superfamily)
VYALTFEGVTTFIAVGLSEPSLPPECLESLESVHILIVPTGVPGMLDAAQAHKLATTLEPNVIVPVGWQGTPGGGEALEQFLGEFGESSSKSVAKWSVRPKEIEQLSGQVVVLEV